MQGKSRRVVQHCLSKGQAVSHPTVHSDRYSPAACPQTISILGCMPFYREEIVDAPQPEALELDPLTENQR